MTPLTQRWLRAVLLAVGAVVSGFTLSVLVASSASADEGGPRAGLARRRPRRAR